MKKLLVLLLICALCFSMAACGGGGGTPQEQLNAFIENNGTQNGDVYEYIYEPGCELVKENGLLADINISSEDICIISSENGVVYVEVIDREDLGSGVVMESGAKIDIAKGTIHYHNSALSNGMDLGGTMDVTVSIGEYTADTMPTINASNFYMTGTDIGMLTDDMKNAMQTCVNLALDCFADFVEKELGLTMADFGYEAYVPVFVLAE